MRNPRLCLLVSPVTTDESISMRLYANGVSHILRDAGCHVTLLRQKNLTRPHIVSKCAEAILRYIFYPLYIITNPAQIVHIIDHTYAFLIPVIKMVNKDCIVSMHNNIDDVLAHKTWSRHKHESLIPWLSEMLFRKSLQCLPQADHIICISRTIRTSLINHGVSAEKLSVVPPPISDIFFSLLNAKELQRVQMEKTKKHGSFYILHVGSNDPAHKNVEHILRCLNQLVRLKLPVRFIKVGDPFTAVHQHLIKKLTIQNSIIHLGHISQPQLKLVYRYSDVLLFPSYYEGCPATPFEALVNGLPVILSEIPSHKEHLKGCAFFVNPDDYRASSAIIQRLMIRPRIARTRISRGKIAASFMRWHVVSGKILSIYNNLLSNNMFNRAAKFGKRKHFGAVNTTLRINSNHL